MSILSKMIRIAGRGDDGKAKAIRTTNDGIIKTEVTNEPKVRVEFPSTQSVRDLEVYQQVLQVKQELQEIKTQLNKQVPVRLTGSYVGYSTEEKPTGKQGDAFLEIDTGNVYIHDGQKWVKL